MTLLRSRACWVCRTPQLSVSGCRHTAPAAKAKAKTAAKQARQDSTLALMPHMGDLLRLSQTDGCRVHPPALLAASCA